MDSEELYSPETNEELIKVGTAKRLVKEPDYTYYLIIPVVYSKSENRYHRVLPDFLIPYKHYTTNTINRASDEDQDLDLYDFPSDSSRLRWIKLLKKKSDPFHSSSLSNSLHNILFRSTSGSVTPAVLLDWFSPGQLAGLMSHPIYKRL